LYPSCDIKVRQLTDEAEFDRRVVTASAAQEIMAKALFGVVVSFKPGVLACYKAESPSDLLWLQREDASSR
jgi:hypothetical protein